MNILLTGGSGFLGRTLAEALAASGHRVVLPLRAAQAGQAQAHPLIHHASMHDLEAMRPEDWRPLLDGVDAVIHAAAIAHIGPSVPASRYNAVNRDASEHLAQAAAQVGVTRFIFVSSIRAQVGATSAAVQTEASPAQPTESYGQSKLEAERLIRSHLPQATVFRPALIVGAEAKGNLATLVRLAALPVPLPLGGLQRPQAMISRDNLIAAIMLALLDDALMGETYVAADEPHPSVTDMLAFLREGMGRPHWLVPVPQALLALPLRLIGKGAAFERIAGGLRVDATKLRMAGWQPLVAPAEAFRALGRASV
jgi:nucleoside-diphosphate-sugar epimerase